MRRHVVTAGPTPIFTSATLAAAGDFSYARERGSASTMRTEFPPR